MFAYVTLGADDIEAAVRFYDPLMAILGQPRCHSSEVSVGWGALDDYAIPWLSVGRPFNGAPASVGNGGMIAFAAPSAALVSRLYEAAIEGGGTDEGPPGLRPQYGAGFYAAYVRDPQGNKLAFACYKAEEADQ